MAKLKTDIRALRRKMDISQTDFWKKLGVTQSGGSRYESTLAMPKPTAILFDLVYGPEAKAFAKLTALRDHSKLVKSPAPVEDAPQ